MIVEVDDVVGGRRLVSVMFAQRAAAEGGAVEYPKHRIVLVTDVQHVIASGALGWRSECYVTGILVEAAPIVPAQLGDAVDPQATEAVTADQHVLGTEAMGDGKRSHFTEQRIEGVFCVVGRVIHWANRRQQVVFHIAERVVVAEPAGATKSNADTDQFSGGVVLAEHFGFGAGETVLLAKIRALRPDLALIPQGIGADRCPAIGR
ncbi:hypothetical protein D3C71_860190 [compost metagenome]